MQTALRSRPAVLAALAVVVCAGCTGSRWAKRDPVYARKYPHHTDDPARVVKQAIDARHVAGRGGWFGSIDGGRNPNAGETTVGRFYYPKTLSGAVETRGGLRGLAVEGGGVAGGIDVGLRLQAPSRLSPYIGISGFAGAAPGDYLDVILDDDFDHPDAEPHQSTLAAAASPEAGVHYWLTPSWRLSAGVRRTYADFEGPSHAEYTTLGLTLSWLDVPGLYQQDQAPPLDVACAASLPIPVPAPPPPDVANPYAELLAAPHGANPLRPTLVRRGMSTTTSRWNAQQFAADYDAAGPLIHPFYDDVQQAVVAALPAGVAEVVDLGGGSGRLAERILTAAPDVTVTVVDQSEPFLELAAGRLERFGDRARIRRQRAQDDWSEGLPRPDAIVSTSALHHLDPGEKNAVFAACRTALAPGGVFINGDEYRPPSDTVYREWLEAWGEHMRSTLASGQIPETFDEIIDRWAERNLDGFGGPRESGDDCLETVEEQTARLYGAGFKRVEKTWGERLWAVLVARTV